MDEQAVESNDTLTSLVDAAEPTLGEGEFFLSEGSRALASYLSGTKPTSTSQSQSRRRHIPSLRRSLADSLAHQRTDTHWLKVSKQMMRCGRSLLSLAPSTNMSQSAMNEAWALLTAQEQAIEEVSLEAEMAKLGDNAVERIKVVEQYMKNNLDSDTYEELRYAVNSAESIQLIEALIKSTAPAKLPIDGYIEPGGITWEDIEAEMFKKHESGQMLRAVDPNHERKIQRMMKEFGGDKPYERIVG